MRRLLILLAIVYGGVAMAAPLPDKLLPSATLQGIAGPLLSVPLHSMPMANLAGRISALQAAHPDLPGLFAVDQVVNLGLDKGLWEPLNNGDWVWRMRVASPQAVALVLHFSDASLPDDSTLRVLSDDGKLKRGPYTQKDLIDGQLWTAVVSGDNAIIELVVPAAARNKVKLQLASIGHAWRSLASPGITTKAGTACYTDVVCQEGDAFRNQIRAVVMIQVNVTGGLALCSATLLNNTSGDGTPYLLTANHCINTNAEANSLVAYWNFQKPQCGAGSGSMAETSSGSTLRAHSMATDFSLVELLQPPDPGFNAFYAGWSRSTSAPGFVVGIHHPQATEKRISENSSPPVLAPLPCTTTSCPQGGGSLLGLPLGGGSPGAPGSSWEVRWSGQPTDEGSSGSGLFTPQGLLIGQLSRGDSSCDNPTGTDYYGTITQDWTGDGTSASRLKDWLDPQNTNPTTLAGINATNTSGGGTSGGSGGGSSGGSSSSSGGSSGSSSGGTSGGGSRSDTASSGGGGGCTMATSGDSGLEYVLLLMFLAWFWRRRGYKRYT